MTVMAMPRIEMVAPTVKRARSDDAPLLFETLTQAFAVDPAVRWMYPDPRQYRRYFPAFAKAFGGAALARGTALVGGDCSGAALWLPPDAAPDEESLVVLLEESVLDRERADVFALFEEMGRHHPEEPHWYLPLIGVVPAQQGRGLGSAIMEHGLALCDEARLPAYLESTNPKNIPLYERHGFTVIGEIRIGRCPPIFPMLRTARR